MVRATAPSPTTVAHAFESLLHEYFEPGSPTLDPALDAALACFARHGLTHTSVPDIARELGVSRATMYRQIGSTHEAARLVIGRELRRFVDSLPESARRATDPDAIVATVEALVTFTVDHPLYDKVMGDETMLVGELLVHLPTVLPIVSSVLVQVLEAGIAAGALRSSEPTTTADLIVRIAAMAAIAPPAEPLHEHLEAGLRPLLEP